MKIGNIEVYGVIYKITNTINNKVYIGQTINGFKKRYKYKGIGIERVHNYCLAYEKSNKYYNKHLFNAIEKYGFDCWDIIEIYDIALSKEELDVKETVYITLFDSFHNGYNQTLGGDGNQGYIPNEETRDKLSKAWWNKSDEEKEEINKKNSIANSGKNNAMYGKNSWDYMTEEAKEKRKKKLRERMSGKNNPNYGKDMSGKNSPNYGKHLSEETKSKISKNHADFSGKNHPQAKAVICLTTKKIFFTVSEGAEYYGIKNSGNIVRCCQGELKSAGKLEDKTKLVWKYIKDFLKKCVYKIL